MEFKCNICNKIYKSYQSLWNHNNKYHNTRQHQTPQINDPTTQINTKKMCKYCNKIFSRSDSKFRHEKTCVEKESNDKKLEIKKLELQLELKKHEDNILKHQLKLQNSKKHDNVTLNKLNKLLMRRNNLIKNSTVNSHNNTVNNNQQIINNNFQIVGLGKEDIIETLTNKQKKLIMDSKYSSLEKIIEIVHCGSYNQFKNIIITNMKDNYMYKYDEQVGHFVLSTKLDVVNSLIDYRMGDLEVIYNDFLEKNKLDNKTKDAIEKFVNKINYSTDKHTDYNGIQHANYKQYKINEIKMLLFNNKDKIVDDICLFLNTEEVVKTIDI
jgi:hypothetical protein